MNLFSHPQGTTVYSDRSIVVKAQSVAHKRFTRFALNDHLFNLSIKNVSKKREPLVLNLSKAIKEAIKNVLELLKLSYAQNLHHQVYITIIEQKILNGLNSGNYDLNTPSNIISNRVLSMLYNYLKSFQTLRLNPSFKIQVKVLSVPHMAYMQKMHVRKPSKKKPKHFYYNMRGK